MRLEKDGFPTVTLQADTLISKATLARWFGCREEDLSEAAKSGGVTFAMQPRKLLGFPPLEVTPVEQIPSLLRGIQEIALERPNERSFQWVTGVDVTTDFTLHTPTSFTVVYEYNEKETLARPP